MDPKIKEAVRRVEPSDIKEIQMWFQMWGLTAPHKDRFSDLGFIVPDVAAGFLYLTNSGVAIIDAYICNPGAHKRIRDEALDAITYRILEAAEGAGVQYLKGDTNFRTILRRAQKFGFKVVGQYASFAKELIHG